MKKILLIMFVILLSSQAFAYVSDNIPWTPEPQKTPPPDLFDVTDEERLLNEQIKLDRAKNELLKNQIIEPEVIVEEENNYINHLLFIFGVAISVSIILLITYLLKRKRNKINHEKYEELKLKYR